VRICPDTNIWIEWARQAPRTFAFDRLGPATVFLVTVTLQELWAGVRSEEEGLFLERLFHVTRRHGRLLNPPGPAWILSGRALAALVHVRSLKPTRLRLLKNDALLAATAFLHDAAVLTRDRGDFDVIAEVLPVRIVTPEDWGDRRGPLDLLHARKIRRPAPLQVPLSRRPAVP